MLQPCRRRTHQIIELISLSALWRSSKHSTRVIEKKKPGLDQAQSCGARVRAGFLWRMQLEQGWQARSQPAEWPVCYLPFVKRSIKMSSFLQGKKKAITLHTALMKRPRSSDPHQGRPGELTQSLLLGCSHQMLRVPGLGGKNAAPRWKRLSRAPSLPTRLPLPSFKPRKAFSERNFSTPRWLRSMRSIRSPPR